MMIQVENNPPRMTKSMLGVEEEVGEIKSLEKSMEKALRDVGDIGVGEAISGTHPLISLRMLG